MLRPTSPKPGKAHDPLAGTPYAVVRPMPTGGMCEVYEAKSEGFVYAVKVLRAEFVDSEQMRDRMRIDAEVPLRIQELRGSPHPNVVQVYASGDTRAGRPYLVMEYLHGHTLHYEVTQRGALPPLEAISYVIHALQGISAVHELGVMHRDLKPANIFLCPQERGERMVKVIDFGYAKVFDTTKQSSLRPLVISTNSFVGTHRWAAPEQAQPGVAKFIDHRADLYTLGLVLYTLLCGRVPFRDLNRRAELLRAQVARTMDPFSAETARRLSSEIIQVLSTALAKDREQRFQSAAAFISALEELSARHMAMRSTSPWSDFPLTAKQHAQMTAELELYPERAAEIRKRFGVSSDAAWLAAGSAWTQKIAADASLQRKWQAEVRRQRQHLLKSAETSDE